MNGIVSVRELAHSVPRKAMRAFAEAQQQSDDARRAIAKLQEAIRITPEFRDAHNNLGEQYGRAGRFADAITEFRRAIEIGPADDIAYLNLSWAYASLGRISEAEDAGRMAVAIDAKNGKAQFLLGFALAMQPGKESEALEHFDLAVSAVPEVEMLSAQIRQRIGQKPGKSK